MDSYSIGPIAGANVFNGIHAWMRDISCAITPQAGGDFIQLAINEAYRNRHGWWRVDHSAKIEIGRPRRIANEKYQVLTVTPMGDKQFTAWFDSQTQPAPILGSLGLSLTSKPRGLSKGLKRDSQETWTTPPVEHRNINVRLVT